METTRHYTGTVYPVNDGAVALHEHKRLGITIPPGGHVDRDELPHEAALRECREETGLEPTFLLESDRSPDRSPDAPSGEPLPRPRAQMLYDINVDADGTVGHQHVDHIYYATVPSREISPERGEAPASDWTWYDREVLREAPLAADVRQFALDAIAATPQES